MLSEKEKEDMLQSDEYRVLRRIMAKCVIKGTFYFDSPKQYLNDAQVRLLYRNDDTAVNGIITNLFASIEETHPLISLLMSLTIFERFENKTAFPSAHTLADTLSERERLLVAPESLDAAHQASKEYLAILRKQGYITQRISSTSPRSESGDNIDNLFQQSFESYDEWDTIYICMASSIFNKFSQILMAVVNDLKMLANTLEKQSHMKGYMSSLSHHLFQIADELANISGYFKYANNPKRDKGNNIKIIGNLFESTLEKTKKEFINIIMCYQEPSLFTQNSPNPARDKILTVIRKSRDYVNHLLLFSFPLFKIEFIKSPLSAPAMSK